jgi:hypothetical protein
MWKASKRLTGALAATIGDGSKLIIVAESLVPGKVNSVKAPAIGGPKKSYKKWGRNAK